MSWFSRLFGFGSKPSTTPQQTDRQIQSIIKEELKRAKDEIATNMSRNGRNASGRSVRGLKVVVNGTTGYIEAPLSFRWMERGRRPNGYSDGEFAGTLKGDGRNLKHIILRWMIDKGVAPRGINKKTGKTISLKSAASLIAYRITTQGTRLHREKLRHEIFTAASRSASRRIAERVTNYHEQRVKEIFRILD